MTEGFAGGLVLPLWALGMLGWLVPRALARVWPEGVWPLLLLAGVSAGLLLVLAMAAFAGLYVGQGAPPRALAEAGWGALVLHFLRLGTLSALVWGPILVLSVAGLPRGWTGATW